LESGPPGERIEPDEPVTGPGERRHLARELGGIVALPSVGDDDDDRPTPNRTSHPAAVELVQARADARPTAPVHDLYRHPSKRGIRIAHAQFTGDARQPSAEDEHFHRRSRACEGV